MHRLGIVAVLAGLLVVPVRGQEATQIIAQLDRLISSQGSDSRTLSEAIADQIDRNSGGLVAMLIPKISEPNASERQLTVYVWAIGLTKDPQAADPIILLHQRNKSQLVLTNFLRALASIGGKQAGEFLVSTLDNVSEKEMRFGILNLLGQMQYEPALPKMEELLKQDPRELYWQCIFVFGKMGDRAVPFLVARINDKDSNTRANVVNVLGTWLLAREAAKPLQDQFWQEKEHELRLLALSSLESTISDPDVMRNVFSDVIAKANDPELVGFARETLDNLEKIKAQVASFAASKRSSSEKFATEYAELFKSAGKKGDYDVLAASSSVADELKLKALRERILQRDSDEAFYDYQKVNRIIALNRWSSPKRPATTTGNQ